MNDILTKSWKKLQKNWLLLVPVIGLSFFVTLVNGEGGGFSGSGGAFYFVALFMLDRAVTAGWLNQMRVVILSEEKTTFNDFLEGIARYFGQILSGSAAFILLAFMLLSLCAFVAQSFVNLPDMHFIQELTNKVKTGEMAVIEKFIQQHPENMNQLLIWVDVFLVGLFILIGLACVIFLWPQYCVFSHISWLKGWKYSQETVFKNIWPVTVLGLIWILPTVFVIVGYFSDSLLIQLFCYVIDMIAKTYFTLVFCQFMVSFDRNRFPDAKKIG